MSAGAGVSSGPLVVPARLEDARHKAGKASWHQPCTAIKMSPSNLTAVQTLLGQLPVYFRCVTAKEGVMQEQLTLHEPDGQVLQHDAI